MSSARGDGGLKTILTVIAVIAVVIGVFAAGVLGVVNSYAHRQVQARLRSAGASVANGIDLSTPRFTDLLTELQRAIGNYPLSRLSSKELAGIASDAPGVAGLTLLSAHGTLVATSIPNPPHISAAILRRREYFIGAVKADGRPYVGDGYISPIPPHRLSTPLSIAVIQHGRIAGVISLARHGFVQSVVDEQEYNNDGLRIEVIDRNGHLIGDTGRPPPFGHLVAAGPPSRGYVTWTRHLRSVPGWRVRVGWPTSEAYGALRSVQRLIALLAAVSFLLFAVLIVALTRQYARTSLAMEEVNETLRDRNDELAQFNRAASHDLQTPLRAVSTNAGRLINILQRDEATRGRPLEVALRIEHVAFRCISLVEGLRLYSHVREAEELLVAFPLNDAVNDAKEDLEEAIHAVGGTVTCTDELGWVHADTTRIRRLLVNLIGNGLKYHRKDVAPVVSVSAAPAPPGFLGVTVTDNGLGIDPDQADNIFVPFVRLHTDDAFEGNGLGLALVKRIVERSGGTIRLDPPPSAGGSSFTFTLPEAKKKKP